MQLLLKTLCVGGLVCSTILSPPAWAEKAAHSQIHAEHQEHRTSVITLDDAIAKAINAAPRLKSSQAGQEAADGMREQAGYRPNPNIFMEAEDIAGSGQFSGISGAEITYGISQQIEIGGKRSNRMAAAEQGYALSQLDTDIEQFNLVRDVHIAYADAVAAQEALRLAQERKELAEQLYKTVRKRVQAAREPEIQQSKAKIGVSTASFNLTRAERESQHTKHVLSSLWAGHDDSFHLADAHFYELKAPPTEHEVETLLDKTPDLKRWGVEYQRRMALAELEESNAIPDPNVTVGVRDLRGEDQQAFMLGLSIPIPVFNANQGNITKARSEAVQVESQGRHAQLTLRNEIFQHLEDLTNAYDQANTLKDDIIPSAEKAFRLSREGYQAGSFPYLEVLDAQRTLFEVKEQHVEALRAYHAASANVQRLTTTGEKK